MTSLNFILFIASALGSHAVLLGGDDVEDANELGRESSNETTTQCDHLHVMCAKQGDVVIRRSATKNPFAKFMTKHFGAYVNVMKTRGDVALLYKIFKLAGGAASGAVDAGVVPIPGISVATRGMVWLSTWVYDKVVGCGSLSFEFCGPHEKARPDNIYDQVLSGILPRIDHEAKGQGLPAMTFDFAAYAFLQGVTDNLKFPENGQTPTEADAQGQGSKYIEEIANTVRGGTHPLNWREKRELVKAGKLSLAAYGLTACASAPDMSSAAAEYLSGTVITYAAGTANTVTTRIPLLGTRNDDLTNPESPWNLWMACFAMLCGELTKARIEDPRRIDFKRGADAESCPQQDTHMVLFDTFKSNVNIHAEYPDP